MDDTRFQSRQAEQSKIAVNWVTRMRQCMRNGDEPQVLEDALRLAAVSPAHLDGRLTLSQAQLDKVIRHAAKYVPDISLRMFARAELTDLGVMGYVAINNDKVGKALDFLYKYHELTSDRYSDRFTIEGDWAVVTPVPVLAHMHEFRNIVEDSFAGNWRVLHVLLGDSVDMRRAHISFDYPAPEYEATYAEVFECTFEFNADRNELKFPVSWLDQPIATADHTMAEVCTAMCERLLGAADSTNDTAQIVRRLLLSRSGRHVYRLEEAATQLRLSTSQLRKRLYKAGTSYKQLVLETRMALARHYLEDTNLPVQEIAYLLDYSQPAPFSRAFKLYYGKSPNQEREENGLVRNII